MYRFKKMYKLGFVSILQEKLGPRSDIAIAKVSIFFQNLRNEA